MKLILTKANTFELDPNKKYVAIILTDDSWTMQQKSEVAATLIKLNVTAQFMPKNTKYKIVEAK